MSNATASALYGLTYGIPGMQVVDLSPAADGLQTDATEITARAVRVTASAAGGSLILPNVVTARGIIFVINDTAGNVVVFPASGESQNGAANGSLTIATGRVGVFIPVPAQVGAPDWRSAAIA